MSTLGNADDYKFHIISFQRDDVFWKCNQNEILKWWLICKVAISSCFPHRRNAERSGEKEMHER
jgi:hypothetical protein